MSSPTRTSRRESLFDSILVRCVQPADQDYRPMMIFSAAPFLGPVLGPLVAGFINQNTNWRWTYYVVIIWSAITLALILVLVPETYDPQLLRKRAIMYVTYSIRLFQCHLPARSLTTYRKRKETGDERWKAPMEVADKSFMEAIQKSTKTPFGKSISNH